jgi:hypothetical protein
LETSGPVRCRAWTGTYTVVHAGQFWSGWTCSSNVFCGLRQSGYHDSFYNMVPWVHGCSSFVGSCCDCVACGSKWGNFQVFFIVYLEFPRFL